MKKILSCFSIVIGFAFLSMTGTAHAAACTIASNTVICTGSANGASIDVPGTGTNGVTVAGTPYPATLAVSGVFGTVASLSVRLNFYTSLVGGSVGNASRNVGILLRSPSGRNLQVMRADGLASGAQTNLTVTLQDGSTELPNPTSEFWTTSGAYAPTAYDGGTLAPGSPNYSVSGGPAMAHSAAPIGTDTLTSVFSGDMVDGNWSLYLVDDAQAANISFSSWDLSITFHPAPPSTTELRTACPKTFLKGQPITMTATVIGDAPTGRGTFIDDGLLISGCSSIPLSGAQATCAISNLSAGAHGFIANYNGDSNNQPSSSNELPVTVLTPADSIFLDGFEEAIPGCADD